MATGISGITNLDFEQKINDEIYQSDGGIAERISDFVFGWPALATVGMLFLGALYMFRGSLRQCLLPQPTLQKNEDKRKAPLSYDQYHIRFIEQPHMQQLFELHVRLWNGSSSYQELVKAIEQEKGYPMAIMDHRTAITLLQEANLTTQADEMRSIQFPACWNWDLNGIVLMNPQESEEIMGGFIAFEVTLGYQRVRYQKLTEAAIRGEYEDIYLSEDLRLERASLRYAEDLTKVGADGITLFKDIIEQAIKTGTVTEGWKLYNRPAYQQIIEMRRSEYGQAYLNYYQTWYRDKINSRVEAERSTPENKLARVKAMGIRLSVVNKKA